MDKLEGLLFRFGIYRCQEGYDCILAAMELVEEDETLLKRLIGGLYPAAAARCGNTRTSVERNIRTSIAKAWDATLGISQRLPTGALHSHPRREIFCVCCMSICESRKPESKKSILQEPMGSALFCFGLSGSGRALPVRRPVPLPGQRHEPAFLPEMGQWRRGDWALQLRSGEKMPSEVKRMRNGGMLRFLWTDGRK